MFKPNPHVPAEPFMPSPAFVAWLDVAAHGYPNADRVPVDALFVMQRNIKAAEAKRLAARGG